MDIERVRVGTPVGVEASTSVDVEVLHRVLWVKSEDSFERLYIPWDKLDGLTSRLQNEWNPEDCDELGILMIDKPCTKVLNPDFTDGSWSTTERQQLEWIYTEERCKVLREVYLRLRLLHV